MGWFKFHNLMGIKNSYRSFLIAGLLLFFNLLSIPVCLASSGLLSGVVSGAAGTVDGALGSVVDDAAGTVDGALGGVVDDAAGTVDGALGGTLEDLSKVVDSLLGENDTNATGSVNMNLPPNLTPAKKKVVVIFQVGSKHYYRSGSFGLMDVAPYIKHDRCYLPARFVAYSLGIKPADVTWNKDINTASFSKNGTTVSATIGKDVIHVNNRPVNINILTELVEPGRTMLPYRFIAEAFGATVKWDGDKKAVIVEYYE